MQFITSTQRMFGKYDGERKFNDEETTTNS
jgi:hypothetical protein